MAPHTDDPTTPGSCLDINLLSAFVAGRATSEERVFIEQHLGHCSVCLALLDAISCDADEDTQTTLVPHAIGPFRLMERIGAGAMGVVYLAIDGRSGGHVALKLTAEDSELSEELSRRLLREGHILQRVQSPHVVPVLEVGRDAGRVYIAMEYVPGRTLKVWSVAAERPVPAIVAAFVQAGKGLIAAHEAGVLHRDFKPGNVIIDDRGIARVVDFGLARLAKRHQAQQTAEQTMTAPGALLGTPGYMSPEQLVGLPADETSDQYSFCVSLYECLYGRRPFEATSVAELRVAAARGRVEFPSRKGVTPTLASVIYRGLRAKPGDRHPSMRSLVTELINLR